MKIQYVTSILISLAIYLAAYKGMEASFAVRILDAAWLMISFTIPLALISSAKDIIEKFHLVIGLFMIGAILFCTFQPLIDPEYNPVTDSFTGVVSAALVAFISAVLLQLILNQMIKILWR